MATESASGDIFDRDGEPGAPPGGSSLDFFVFGWNMSEIFIRIQNGKYCIRYCIYSILAPCGPEGQI